MTEAPVETQEPVIQAESAAEHFDRDTLADLQQEVDLRQEVEEVDLGDLPPSDQHRVLFKRLRVRSKIENSIAHMKASCAAMIAAEESRLRAFDYQFTQEMRVCTALLLGDRKTRSIKTPFGVAGFRAQKALLEIANEFDIRDAVADGTLPRGVIVEKFTTAISKTALNELFAETGEIPPGCTVRPANEKFYVK